jgi:hypothetical protein
LNLKDIVTSIERYMMQHFNDTDSNDDGQERITPDEWINDIACLTSEYEDRSAPTPTRGSSTPSIGSVNSQSSASVLSLVFGSSEPLLAMAATDVRSPEVVAKQVLGAAVKAGYPVLLKHYNRVDSVGIIASALDPRFNLMYYKKEGHGELIHRSYIPLYAESFLLDCLKPFIDVFTQNRIEETHRAYLAAFPADAPKENSSSDVGPEEDEDSDGGIYAKSASTIQAKTFTFATSDKSFDYFQRLRVTREVDPFLAWDTELGIAYPSLARMAYDMLSIPASSTSVERLFSVGSLVVTKRRNRLSAESIRYLMCINKWLPDFGRGAIRTFAD